jgi:ubiquinone biosynthesis protein
MATRLSERRRTIARVREIAQVAARHGFGYAFERRPLRRGPAVEQSPAAIGRHLREMLDELGPTFVKFGQLLSTRPDLVPPEVAVELRQLQDAVTPVPFEDIERVVTSQLGLDIDRLFRSFDPVPVAAASIGQVHLAELPTGRKVAVKVQRPNAPARVEDDLVLFYHLARLLRRRVDRAAFIDPVAVVDEFARSIRRELDYRIEARNAETFRRNFADEPRVAVPKVYWTYSGQRVLTLERLEGPKLRELDLAATDMAERRRIAVVMTEAWLEMIFRHGVFHGDPHPANLFVLPDGRLGLVDFGQVGTLSDADMRRLVQLFLDAMNEKVDSLPRRLYDLGVRFNRTQEEEFRLELREVYYRYYGASLGEIDPLAVLREAFDLIYRMHMRLPARFALLDKCLATLASVGAELYPDFNVFEVARPYAAELVARRYSPVELLERAREELSAYGDLVRELPYQVHDTLEQLRDGEVEVQFRHRGLDELIGKADVVFNRLAIAIVASASVLGAGIFAAADKGPELFGANALALVALLFSMVLAGILAFSIVRSGRI